MKTIGERIALKRQNMRYTLEKLAEKVGVTSSTISKYEKNKISIPSDKIELLAKALKCTPAHLMGWEENKKEVKESKSDIDEDFKIAARDYRDLPEDKQKLFKSMMKNFLKGLKEE